MALISDLPNATPQKSDLMEIQNGQTSSNNSSVGQLMQLSASENLAPAYDASAGVYAVGNFVSYNGTLYQCDTAIATPEAFDATKWTAKKVVDMTGEDIPVNTLTPNTSINSAINACFGRTGSDIAVSDTDATTIADKLDNVPTFNLTTSDNNKLLGVSVSGSDISVGTVGASNNISLDEGSAYSTYVNNKFDYFYNQYGNLLLFTFDFEMKARSASSGWAEIFKTSSAISLKNAIIVSCISSLNNWNRVRINSNGTVDLNLVSSASNTERISIQIMAFLA